MKPQRHDVVQGSPEWAALRLGRMTASCASEIGNCGKGLETLCAELAAERLTGVSSDSWGGNQDTQRGKELENAARTIYGWEFGRVEQVGFFSYGEFAGCSPDGLVGKDGGIEIKCPNNRKFLSVCLDGKIEPGYFWQMQMNLLITGRKWWDYVCYNPNFKTPLYIQRVMPDGEKHEALLSGLEIGEKQIKEIISKMEAGTWRK